MAQIIPKNVLEDIRFRNDIVEVIGAYLNVKRAGSTFKALCPFHKEKTPSFNVNQQKQIFHCFGCGIGGDVFKFVMQYEKVDFVTAAKILAHRAGVRLELEEGEGEGTNKSLLYSIHEELAHFYQRCLLSMKSAEIAREYLQKRELPSEIIEEFVIGYAPDRWDTVLKWAEKKKHPPELLETGGLILKSSRADAKSQYYDRFRNRIMFPISDEQGRVIGFSGRAIDEKDKGAKYVNSPETPLFHKSRVLYALDKARRQIVDSREAIISEGQIDVIRCHQAGFKTAVASQGTAFTEDHTRILRRYADNVILVFDPDRAGQDAAIKTAVTFLESELAVRVATLPKGDDPDSFIRKRGAEAFRKILDEAASVVVFQIAVLSSREDASSEVGTMRIAKAVLQTIGRSPSAVQQSRLIEEAAALLKLPVSALRDDLRQTVRRSSYNAPSKPDDSLTKASEPYPPDEVAFCEHLIQARQFPTLMTLVGKYLPPEILSNDVCRAMVKTALKSARTKREIQDIVRDEDGQSDELQAFAARLEVMPDKITSNESSLENALKDMILRIWRNKLRRERAELEKLNDGKLSRKDEERHSQITHELKALNKWEDGSMIIEIRLG